MPPPTRKEDLLHSAEVEAAYLSCVLASPEILTDPEKTASLEDFYSLQNQIIFQAIGQMHAEGRGIDTITLFQYLKDRGDAERSGGIQKLTSIENQGGGFILPAVPEYLRILKEKRARRMMAAEGERIKMEAANPADAAASIATAEKTLESIRKAAEPAKTKKADDLTHDYIVVPKEAWYSYSEFYRRAFAGSTNASHNYHLAIFLTMAGVLLGKTVLTEEGGDEIYPCLYTVIVGRAGFARKDSAINRGIKFLRAVDPTVSVIETIGSIEQFIGTMDNRQKELLKEGVDGPFRLVLRFREFKNLVAKAGQKATSNIWGKLCELYDCPPKLETAVKNNNAEVTEPVGALIAGTAPKWLKTMDPDDIEAGPGRRIIWVPGDAGPRLTGRRRVDREYFDAVVKLMKERMDEYRQRSEPTMIPFAQDATDYIDQWAQKHERRQSNNELIDSLTAGDEVAVRKIALIYAALDKTAEITIIHLKAAIAFVEFLFESRFPIFSEHGLTPLGEIENKILKRVAEAGPEGISWRELRRGQQRVSREDFDRVMKSLTMGFDPALRAEKRFGKAWVWIAE